MVPKLPGQRPVSVAAAVALARQREQAPAGREERLEAASGRRWRSSIRRRNGRCRGRRLAPRRGGWSGRSRGGRRSRRSGSLFSRCRCSRGCRLGCGLWGGLRLLRRLPGRTIKIAFLATRALGLLAGIIVDAGNLNRAAIGVDRNGAATILKRVLGLRGAEAARQQEHGDSETLLHCCDLLSREPHSPEAITQQ